MANIHDLPEELLTNLFGSVLRLPHPSAPGCTFGARAARSSRDALALAGCSPRLTSAFASCLVTIDVCTPAVPPAVLRSLLRVSGGNLRRLTLGERVSPAFGDEDETASVFATIAEHNPNIEFLSICARSVLVRADAAASAFGAVCARLAEFRALQCSAADMTTICRPDFSRLSSLEISVDNSYECDRQLCALWSTLGDRLHSISLSIWSYDGSRQNAQGDIVGDGLESFRTLRSRNLPLSHVQIGRLPIRALVLAHTLFTEQPNSALRSVELRKTEVWPAFMVKLAAVPSLREIRMEKCRIDSADVPMVLKEAGGLLRTFWANVGHWTQASQLAALRECPNLEKADLYCRYEDGQQDVTDYCEQFGHRITHVRVGGPGFEPEHVFKVVGLLPDLSALSVCTAPLAKRHIEALFKQIGSRLTELDFDHAADGMNLEELLNLIVKYAPNLKEVSFPFSKLVANTPVEPGLSARAATRRRQEKCIKLLNAIEDQAPHLDVESLRVSMWHTIR